VKPAKLGFSGRIFRPQGDPEGLKIVEKSNWTGCGLVIPRSLFGEARGREELDRTGVYVLIGPGEHSQLPRVYVGEGDPIRPRLEQHARGKDFWTRAVAFTGKGQNLNKRQGVLKPDEAGYVLTQDYTFSSPSMAAGALLGRSAHGRIEWKAKDGRTLKELQEPEATST
jgi:hypothetical protein